MDSVLTFLAYAMGGLFTGLIVVLLVSGLFRLVTVKRIVGAQAVLRDGNISFVTPQDWEQASGKKRRIKRVRM